MALSVTSDLSIRACGWVAKNSTRGRRPSALFLATRLQASMDKSDVTRKSHTLIVLLYALRIREQFWLPNVDFVHHNNLFIESWISLMCYCVETQNQSQRELLTLRSFFFTPHFCNKLGPGTKFYRREQSISIMYDEIIFWDAIYIDFDHAKVSTRCQ